MTTVSEKLKAGTHILEMKEGRNLIPYLVNMESRSDRQEMTRSIVAELLDDTDVMCASVADDEGDYSLLFMKQNQAILDILGNAGIEAYSPHAVVAPLGKKRS